MNYLMLYFSSILSNRSQIVKYNNFLSEPIHVSQGNYFSPLQFLLFINVISSIIKHSYDLFLADDVKIFKFILELFYISNWC